MKKEIDLYRFPFEDSSSWDYISLKEMRDRIELLIEKFDENDHLINNTYYNLSYNIEVENE